MTTTGCDDQFTNVTETILARNVRDECQQVHDLQVRLAAAIQRAEAAGAELAKLRGQKPVAWCDADGDVYSGESYPNVWPSAVPLYLHPAPDAATVRDADRYRWLRDNEDELPSRILRMIRDGDPDLDTAIDAARGAK